MRKAFFVFALLWSVCAVADKILVNVPVTNLFKYARDTSGVISQAIYNLEVVPLKRNGNYLFVRVPDGYRGWMKISDLARVQGNERCSHEVEVKSLFAKVYQEQDTTKHRPLLTVPFATKFPVIQIMELPSRWIQVRLANGDSGWIQRGDVRIDPKPLTMQQMLVISRKFLGLPYQWGGVSTYGFDCSGYVQMLYQEMGVMLPRDATKQSKSPLVEKVSKNNLQPGDLLYFGWDNKISHAGLYLGDGKFISITTYIKPVVQIANFSLPYWQKIFLAARRLKKAYVAPQFNADVKSLPPKVIKQMKRYTWRKKCPVPLKNLAYVKLRYWGFDDRAHVGTLIVNRYLTPDVVSIFGKLYQERFAIQKMRPMYVYKGNDEKAMEDNNTSAFNCRSKTEFPNEFSVHSYGGAIDINPLINPYVNGKKVLPKGGKKYVDRTTYYKGKVMSDSDIISLFTDKGWRWGGNFPSTIKDYQHFERPLERG